MRMTTAVRVRRGLEESIVTGRLQPGDQLDVDAVCAEYACSRTPVREALHQLAASGLVEVRSKRGTFVSRLTVRELTERFEVMAELEGLCASLAASRMDAQTAALMHTHLAACEERCAADDVDGYYDTNSDFHRAVYAGSGNAFLRRQAELLQSNLEVYRRLQLRVGDRIRRSLAEHRAIADAIAMGDSATARRLAHDHVVVQGDEFTELVIRLQGRVLD
ncbi:GntR family transcriptional regulator [Nocardioides acrostichi]|uniref:GntR family transcriptional regulator n=1 Tax=Nocardioides acrostichi TaxID=2784339 RepID=A0A930UWC2_9ACTN|nr:GntR family transcriptional regulator [Nocardioides acrostichi]MBF4161351.1 GntR family transcriptional regulator [Nocardioides acrostichi]